MRETPTPWAIAGLSSLTLGFSRGIHSSFGVFYVALLDAFHWSRGVTAVAYSIALIVDAVVSPVVGHLLDRFGPRKVVGVGCILLACGLILSSRIGSLWEFYLFFGLLCALGLSFTGMVPHVVLISEWFSARRASALGAVYSATGVGIMILVPLTQWLISSWGWERVFQVLALAVVVLLFPLVATFYRRGPHVDRRDGHSAPRGQWTARLALRSLQFRSLFLARIMAAGGVTVIITHQVAHVVDIGYSRLFAATVFGLMGITSTCGRMLFGFIADLISKPAAYTANILTTLVGIGALMAARDASLPWLLYCYVIFFGIGYGSRAVIFSALSADLFAGKGFGSIYGYFTISVGVGGALGSWLGGFLYDVSGSYLFSFAFSAAALVLSDLCVWLASCGWVKSYDERLRQAAMRRP